jgi:hypothetical protein
MIGRGTSIGIKHTTVVGEGIQTRESLVWLFSTKIVDDAGEGTDTVAARENSVWEF